MRVSLGQPATIHAVLTDESGHELKPRSMTAFVAPAGHSEAASAMEMTPSSDSDTQYSYTFTPPTPPAPSGTTITSTPSGRSRAEPPQEYQFVVKASADANGVEFQKAASGFFYVQHAGAQLDRNNSSVELVRGNLELTLGIQVEQPGTYQVNAELWGGHDGRQPVAFARQRLEDLRAGAQRVTLLFGGKIIRDSTLDGPYHIRNVQLARVDSLPPHESEPIAELMGTADYEASDFY